VKSKDLVQVTNLNPQGFHQSNSPCPLLSQEGDIASLWQREVRRDLINTNERTIYHEN